MGNLGILRFKIVLIFFLICISCTETKIKYETENGVPVISNPEYGEWQNRETLPITFDLEVVYGKDEGPEEEIFSGISYLALDKKNNLYLFDWSDKRIVAFDKQGKFLWQAGREGSGPGEFDYVNGIVTDGDSTIYVANSNGGSIEVFDLLGNYKNTIKIKELNLGYINLLGFISPNKLALSKTINGAIGVEVILLTLINEKFEIASRFEIKDEIGKKLPEMIGLAMDTHIVNDELWAAGIDEYKFRLFDMNGKHKMTIKRDFHKLVRPGIKQSEMSVSMRNFSSLGSPFKLNNNFMLAFAYWPLNIGDPDALMDQQNLKLEYNSTIDLFTTKGELLYSLEYDMSGTEIGYPYFVDSEGKLYTRVNDPYPQVRRYKVNISE